MKFVSNINAHVELFCCLCDIALWPPGGPFPGDCGGSHRVWGLPGKVFSVGFPIPRRHQHLPSAGFVGGLSRRGATTVVRDQASLHHSLTVSQPSSAQRVSENTVVT